MATHASSIRAHPAGVSSMAVRSPRRVKKSLGHRAVRAILRTIKQEPVQVQGIVQTVLALVITMGAHWSPEVTGSVLAVTASMLALASKTQVTPVANPHDRRGRPLRPTPR